MKNISWFINFFCQDTRSVAMKPKAVLVALIFMVAAASCVPFSNGNLTEHNYQYRPASGPKLARRNSKRLKAF